MSKEDTLSGKGRSQQLGRMGEYSVMAQLLSKSWVSNVYTPAADTGVDLILLTKDQKLRRIQVKTSKIYPSGGTWFMNIFQEKLKQDLTQPDMFYVLAEGHPPSQFFVFPVNELVELFRQQFTGTCEGNFVEFMGDFPVGRRLQFRHHGQNKKYSARIDALNEGKTINKYWNKWDLLK
jgi:hypothetical protein